MLAQIPVSTTEQIDTEVAPLLKLFDLLHSLPFSTQTTLWAERYQSAPFALRLWCSAHNVKLRETKTAHGHSLDAIRPNYSTIVTVRLDSLLDTVAPFEAVP